MPVTYVIKFRVAAHAREEFMEHLCCVLNSTKNEPTYYEAILHRDPESENSFMLYENGKLQRRT